MKINLVVDQTDFLFFLVFLYIHDLNSNVFSIIVFKSLLIMPKKWMICKLREVGDFGLH